MFSWFRKSPRPPSPVAENPGHGHAVRVAFSNAQKSWEETDDLAVSLAAALSALGHKATAHQDWVELEGGFSLLPQVVNVEPTDNSGVRTTSTIQTSHDSLIPGGVFEFQHATGNDIRESFAAGFKSWAEVDLPVFLDALRSKATACMFLVRPPGDAASALGPDRRVVFGPTVQMVQQSAPGSGDHEFCPCCLFTNSIGAFEDLLKDRAFYGIRIFVTRDTDGQIQADCRVNGIDRPVAVDALVKYAQAWPDRGLEYRKQYVCVQTLTGPDS